jgi:hypothetical protein
MCMQCGVDHIRCWCGPLSGLLSVCCSLVWVGVCYVVGVVCVQRVFVAEALQRAAEWWLSRAGALYVLHRTLPSGMESLLECGTWRQNFDQRGFAAWSQRGGFVIFDSVYCVMCVWD